MTSVSDTSTTSEPHDPYNIPEQSVQPTPGVSNQFDNWDNAGLKNSLLRGIYAYGFEQPSKIQQKSIIPMTKGNDIIAQAQSGTGKTGAFTISVLQLVNADIKTTQAMIISPTRGGTAPANWQEETCVKFTDD